jgi:hypothetical protein
VHRYAGRHYCTLLCCMHCAVLVLHCRCIVPSYFPVLVLLVGFVRVTNDALGWYSPGRHVLRPALACFDVPSVRFHCRVIAVAMMVYSSCCRLLTCLPTTVVTMRRLSYQD